jgi:hypothetical protein
LVVLLVLMLMVLVMVLLMVLMLMMLLMLMLMLMLMLVWPPAGAVACTGAAALACTAACAGGVELCTRGKRDVSVSVVLVVQSIDDRVRMRWIA